MFCVHVCNVSYKLSYVFVYVKHKLHINRTILRLVCQGNWGSPLWGKAV